MLDCASSRFYIFFIAFSLSDSYWNYIDDVHQPQLFLILCRLYISTVADERQKETKCEEFWGGDEIDDVFLLLAKLSFWNMFVYKIFSYSILITFLLSLTSCIFSKAEKRWRAWQTQPLKFSISSIYILWHTKESGGWKEPKKNNKGKMESIYHAVWTLDFLFFPTQFL